MGTNYYLEEKKCDHCGRRDPERRHIGKSSWGWVFSLHIIPEEGIDDLDDWVRLFEETKDTHEIRNEYGKLVSTEELMLTITERGEGRYCREGTDLARHEDRSCVKQGAGTWDCIAGEFS